MHFCVNAVILHNNHRKGSATHVVVFRMMTRIQKKILYCERLYRKGLRCTDYVIARQAGS